LLLDYNFKSGDILGDLFRGGGGWRFNISWPWDFDSRAFLRQTYSSW